MRLAQRPELVIETKDRLLDLPPGIHETPLTDPESPDFRYRYHGLRLLLAAQGRLYLVPAEWTEESRTLVLPYDGSVRVQLSPAD